jgi:hypothetical protein
MRSPRARLLPIIAVAALFALAAPGRAAEALRFDSELIRLEIAGDTLRIEGFYRFLNRGGRPRLSLFYPYPADSMLGEAWTESLAWRPEPAAPWEPAEFSEREDGSGVFWKLPIRGSTGPEVRTVYRQLLRGRYARYIVTTTSAWGRPLSHARFELSLPSGAELTRCSFPFERGDDGIWVFEAERFQPSVDIIVEWMPAGG